MAIANIVFFIIVIFILFAYLVVKSMHYVKPNPPGTMFYITVVGLILLLLLSYAFSWFLLFKIERTWIRVFNIIFLFVTSITLIIYTTLFIASIIEYFNSK
ncbi:hypothetical protein COR50_17300 [Chitinophaga caeni]|uniref:Uncharacterized protein n=1 Tax=Chitinophaga caeni TaxID=2029983 RepID=A0A291QXV7_9BACT|nr:hypothetical protein COR50_17300 [Chitinophaga caeni]